MCRHRAADRWSRWWERFTIGWLALFAAAETVGLTTAGPDAAYTAYWRRLAGQLEPCRHTRLGRAVIVTVCVWLAVHLGWGKFGIAPTRPWFPARPNPPRREVPS